MQQPTKQYWVLGIILLVLISGCGRAVPTWSIDEPINAAVDPLQTPTQTASFIKEIPGGKLTVTPMADYRISAMVVSKKNYYTGWAGGLAPADLALVWGKLTEPDYDRYLQYSQSNRWYFFRFQAGAPFDMRYVIEHSSNHHLIPANANVRAALSMVRKKQLIVLEGYLVNIRGVYHGGEVWWNTSLTRDDTADGACELFYVKSVRLGSLIYE